MPIDVGSGVGLIENRMRWYVDLWLRDLMVDVEKGMMADGVRVGYDGCWGILCDG